MGHKFKVQQKVVVISDGSGYLNYHGYIIELKTCSERKPYYVVKHSGGATREYWEYQIKPLNASFTIKDKVESLYTWVKPYEKYIIVAALAFLIDHFLLKGKFFDRFQAIAENSVKRMISFLDTIVEKITPEVDGGDTNA